MGTRRPRLLGSAYGGVDRFGRTPRDFAYDRGGWSRTAVHLLRRKKVRNIGIAPKAQGAWLVEGGTKRRLMRAHAGVERCIGTLNTSKYGFNRPAARTEEMMVACGHRAMIASNLNLLLRMKMLDS
ncbi:MAG: hypothetical protein IPK13_10460 [Deltaproteobacteria bacterium]|nr:hypothetical protein [Deltaproteobacteria bacterium]